MEDFSRYARQTALEGFGIERQRRLRSASVAVVGAGGVGCGALAAIVGAGIGRVRVIDCDKVQLSNLHRQTLYREADLGKPKAACAASALRALNSQAEILPLDMEFCPGDSASENAVQDSDIIIDATDSFASRAKVSSVCEKFGKRLVMAAAQGFQAQTLLFGDGFYLRDALADTCSASGESGGREPQSPPIFAPAAHMSGALAAAEAILALAAEFERYEPGKFISFDIAESKFFKTNIRPKNAANSS